MGLPDCYILESLVLVVGQYITRPSIRHATHSDCSLTIARIVQAPSPLAASSINEGEIYAPKIFHHADEMDIDKLFDESNVKSASQKLHSNRSKLPLSLADFSIDSQDDYDSKTNCKIQVCCSKNTTDELLAKSEIFCNKSIVTDQHNSNYRCIQGTLTPSRQLDEGDHHVQL